MKKVFIITLGVLLIMLLPKQSIAQDNGNVGLFFDLAATYNDMEPAADIAVTCKIDGNDYVFPTSSSGTAHVVIWDQPPGPDMFCETEVVSYGDSLWYASKNVSTVGNNIFFELTLQEIQLFIEPPSVVRYKLYLPIIDVK